MTNNVWHDARGNNVTPFVDRQGEIIKLAARIKSASEMKMTPARVAGLADDTRLLQEAIERYGNGCGD